MRYQEPIYTNSGIYTNRTTSNVNMSSDMYIFETPIYNMDNAIKINCGGSVTGGIHILNPTLTTISINFNITNNFDSIIDTNAKFRYEVYKYSDLLNEFSATPVYKSIEFEQDSFTSLNTLSDDIPIDKLGIDGEYLIKGYYRFENHTDFLKKIGKTVDTRSYIHGKEYGIYNSEYDYYFAAINQAQIPLFTQNNSDSPQIGGLTQQVFIPTDGQTQFLSQTGLSSQFIVTLNGLVLSLGYDYSYSDNLITLNEPTYPDDIISIVYSSVGGIKLVSDSIVIESPILSGITDNQGFELVYFNTTSEKYEIYTSINSNGSVMVILNGVTLAENLDYYKSITNPNRLIFNGDLLFGDIVTMIYYPNTGVSMGLSTRTPEITWKIDKAPSKINGFFILEVALDKEFSNIHYSGETEYVIGSNYYSHVFDLQGQFGTKLYYRVINNKRYETICGEIIDDSIVSEIISIVIATNSINSY